MLRHLTTVISLSRVTPLAPMPDTASRLLSTACLITTDRIKASVNSLPSASIPVATTTATTAVSNSILVESRRWRAYSRACRRIGRPIKNRSMRHKEWWVRRNTPFFDYDSSLTAENADFVQDVNRDDYTGAKTEAEEGDEEEPAAAVAVASPLKDAPWDPQPWTNEGIGTRRCGVLALKIGVLPQWLNDGTRYLCTMFQILDCHVINYTSPEDWDRQFNYDKFTRVGGRFLKKLQEKRGIYGVQTVGAMSCDPQRFSNEYSGLFTKAGVLPKRKLTRYFVTPNAAIKPGTELTAKHFRVGDHVIVEGRTIGRGYEGVMIRWGYKGGPSDAHGCSRFHRRPGNIGMGIDKANVPRGKKMPGHMGNEFRVGFNHKIVRINTKYNVVYIRGVCPGPPHAVMRLFDSTHHDQVSRVTPEDHPPLPTYIEGVTSGGGGGGEPDVNGDIFDETLFDFSKPSISYSTGK